MIELGIILGLVCMVGDFYAAATGDKTPLHQAAHIAFGGVFMGLACLLWILR